MRPFIALYVGGMGSREQNFYNQLVQRYGFEDAAREVQDLYLDGQARRGDGGAARRAHRHGRARGPARTTCASGWRVYREAGVGTLGITPMAWTREGAWSSCGWSPSWPR